MPSPCISPRRRGAGAGTVRRGAVSARACRRAAAWPSRLRRPRRRTRSRRIARGPRSSRSRPRPPTATAATAALLAARSSRPSSRFASLAVSRPRARRSPRRARRRAPRPPASPARRARVGKPDLELAVLELGDARAGPRCAASVTEARELRHAEVLLVERAVDLLHDLLEAIGAHHVAVPLHALDRLGDELPRIVLHDFLVAGSSRGRRARCSCSTRRSS